MAVENSRDEKNDEFPIGMRVLAVDDDPICLKLLETLLIKCQYHATTTSQAVTALKMLRENKNKFDLVISDVLMPDMDGFKLLELVGLEMDLPVIMLSANGDTKMVMKGISHGACDYLLKPVRLEELKNIWQHVIRKKIDSRDSNNSNSRIGSDGNGSRSANSDHDAKWSRKRKEKNEDDDDEDQDENEDNEDPSSQKKPRVVWSVDLHYKFVAAVNQLGLDKAVPKKILELMNDDKLTRENVASHLQKYRMYLKKISSMANQQTNMVTALGPLGGPDYLRMNSVNFLGFNGSPQFPSNSMGSVPPSGAIGRLNTPARFGFPWIPPSGLVPSGQSQISTSFTDSTKFHRNSLPNHTGVVVQGMPASLKFDDIQKNDAVLNGSSNSILNLPNSSLTMQGRSSLERQSFQDFGVASNSMPNLLDHNRCNGNWPAAVVSQPSQMNPLENFPMQNPNIVRDNMLQNMIYPSRPVWNPNFPNNPINSSTGSTQNAFAPSNPSENLHRNMGFTSMAQPKFDSLCPPYDRIQQNNSGVDMAMKMKQGQFTEQGGRPLGNFNACNGADSLEDVVTAMLKHEVDGMTNDNED